MGGRPAGEMERKEGEAYRGRAWSEGVLEGGREASRRDGKEGGGGL